MDPLLIAMFSVLTLLGSIFMGVHIAVALILVSFGSLVLIRDFALAERMLAAAASDAIRAELYSIIPLFVLLGSLVSISGMGKDTFALAQRMLGRIRGGLGLATVQANAVFASITGISIASATVFAQVATPEMRKYGYSKQFSVGVVAGSSVLGMLLPPSLLLIVYGVTAEESIGRLFIAGILPGILLALLFSGMILLMAYFWPKAIFNNGVVPARAEPGVKESDLQLALKGLPILGLIAIILGGIYTGLFNPTEAAAVGAAVALLIAATRPGFSWFKLWSVLKMTASVSVAVLFLMMAATFYSRTLAISGLPMEIADYFNSLGWGPWGFLLVYLAAVIILGFFIDSVSIMLILLPIAVPIAVAFGFDKIWLGIVTVIAVEIGLLSPPFGLSVFTVKAALTDSDYQVGDIFVGVVPFIFCMLLCIGILVVFPQLTTMLIR